MRFFKEKTQSEVAKELRISQVQVSRLEKKILKQLRKEIKEQLYSYNSESVVPEIHNMIYCGKE